MGRTQSLGRDFGWLWAAYAASAVGTWLALDAFPLIAILVLHSSPAQVSLLSAAGLAVGALIALPLGPWVEFRRKRPVMIAMDLFRLAALLSLPAAYLLGGLTFTQLVVVSVVVAAANIVFTAASGACLKALVRKEDLLKANGRFESTMWTATVIGPPLGGALIGVFGPLTTVVVDAVSYLLSALGVRAIGGHEPRPAPRNDKGFTAGEMLDGWRFILRHPQLRPLFLNTSLVNGLIMATAPLLAVLLLGEEGFAPWQYGLAFGVPCLGGLLGSRIARPLVSRFGQHRVLIVSGALRACWLLGLPFVGPGIPGLLLVVLVELGLITCMGVFNPVYATYRLERTTSDRVARVLSAWSITSSATIALLTLLWGLLASLVGPRTAIAVAGVLILCTPLLLPRREHAAPADRPAEQVRQLT
ncbi:MFS transporter [Kutzneria albida]|uniref:Transmembrane efflux protein n=1 Tax=Kutzneria albida DSM 43870 TaxID=1449976 RepID=W5VZY8_9PSEU|nr:MFS transporter [Kutzneria albida]AHH94503.1 transmembrane efflux protein [Kutzneria albida DSM 43870]